MKGLKIVSIVLLVIGLLLFLVGYLFRIMNWPDMFKGVISGPILILIGLILLIINRLKK